MAASNRFMHNLSMAACEWFLMFLMFIDAALGFILAKFAHHCELQTPCLFCTRLDHVFSDENPQSYLTLFCYQHRSEISCLISCDLHQKLVDVRQLCDDCFMSIMNRNQCSHGASSKGKTGMKGFQKPFLNRNLVRGPSASGTCSCCKRHWKGKPSSRRLIQPGPTVTMKPPLPRIAGHSRYRRRNVFKRGRNGISGASTPCHVDDSLSVDLDSDMDAMSDFCPDLRFNSDSESEFSFFEEDDTLKPGIADSGDDFSVRNGDSGVDSCFEKDESCSQKRDSMDNSCVGIRDSGVDSFVRKDESCSRKGDSIDDSCVRNGNSGEVSCVGIGDSGVGKGDSGDRAETSSLASKFSIQENQSRAISIPSRPQSEKSGLFVDNIKENGLVHDNVSERSEGYESPVIGSSVSEIKSEGVIERLKRQIEKDQQRLLLLHTELEEERNAASIAADEAMAMITRLQEEKASLHMEALQYLRMMDEQAEYDMEALDKANDLVADKDKEIQDLEAELEYFRGRYEDELMENRITNGKSKNVVQENSLGVEDERKYILERLSELEKRFQQFDIENGRVKKEDENGSQLRDTLEFIQEIGHYLHDLQTNRRCQSVS